MGGGERGGKGSGIWGRVLGVNGMGGWWMGEVSWERGTCAVCRHVCVSG